MSSGSYFTLYRKNTRECVASSVVDALKNEYYLSNKKGIFGDKQDEDVLKKDIPVLMHSDFKADSIDTGKSDIYYDAEGYEHKLLLEFHFGSVFTCLKEHFRLNPYKFSESSVLVSKAEAAKILQAVEYVIGEEYSKKFEDVLGNEYVSLLGESYTPFESRFRSTKTPIYIDKEGHSYVVNFGDYCSDREVIESDNDIKYNLGKLRACLLAFLNAEECSYNGEELVLEYTAY